ncbi:TrbI/VirB10 family protein [Sphingomonas canadensis]|uniref:TrbI/VirB10 family protein n=1 Tax=Sphingomonas canadensis TaxID=1219257 RepID=A0ABW3H0R9_9SPHN|nr:TrbI/VirB10 family protein [Sphingomonas canadensis]MCW3835061.1 conjugal transfer protein TrbI [Sphingomonas canadensis]
MSELPEAAAAPKADPETLVIRAQPARAIRFRRGVIIAAAAIASLALMVIAWMALKPVSFSGAGAPEERVRTDNRAPADTLSGLPSSYGDAPRLGPPLPGDLGKPILDHQRAMAAEGSPAPQAQDTTEHDRRLAEAKAARESPLLAATGARSAASGAAQGTAPIPANTAPAPPTDGDRVALDPARDPNAQQRKIDFASGRDTGAAVNPHRLEVPASPYMLSAGSVIAASLITGIRSDLPGLVTAQVTENAFDSATGRILLIPQGARLIGTYDSVIAYGQSRALVVWQRIVLPDGASIRIDNVPATDPSGYTGLADKVDFHTWSLLKGIALSTVLGVTPELALSGGGDLVDAIRRSSQDNVARAGDQITQRNLQVQPTITIRPGAPVRLVVHKDLILAPWRG